MLLHCSIACILHALLKLLHTCISQIISALTPPSPYSKVLIFPRASLANRPLRTDWCSSSRSVGQLIKGTLLLLLLPLIFVSPSQRALANRIPKVVASSQHTLRRSFHERPTPTTTKRRDCRFLSKLSNKSSSMANSRASPSWRATSKG